MNWGQLKTAVQQSVHRTDLDLDSIQELAAAQITRDLDVIENEAMESLTISQEAGVPLFSAPLPTLFGRVKALIGPGGVWSSLDLQSLLQRQDRGGYYAISGSKVYLGGAGPCVMIFSESLALLADDADSNAVLRLYANVYLEAMLWFAYERVQDLEMAGQHQASYVMAYQAANADKAMVMRAAGAVPTIVGGR